MKIRLSEVALGQLRAIRDWSEGHWGPRQAERFLQTMSASLKRLNAHPEIGRRREDIGPDLRSIRCRPYGIYYRIEGDTVRIVAILHESRDVARAALDPPPGMP